MKIVQSSKWKIIIGENEIETSTEVFLKLWPKDLLYTGLKNKIKENPVNF